MIDEESEILNEINKGEERRTRDSNLKDNSLKEKLKRENREKFPLYRAATGALIYVTTTMKPEIAFAVSEASRLNDNPNEKGWRMRAPSLSQVQILNIMQRWR